MQNKVKRLLFTTLEFCTKASCSGLVSSARLQEAESICCVEYMLITIQMIVFAQMNKTDFCIYLCIISMSTQQGHRSIDKVFLTKCLALQGDYVTSSKSMFKYMTCFPFPSDLHQNNKLLLQNFHIEINEGNGFKVEVTVTKA